MTENEKKLLDAAVDWVRAYNAHLDIAKYQKMTALREAANRVSDDRLYGGHSWLCSFASDAGPCDCRLAAPQEASTLQVTKQQVDDFLAGLAIAYGETPELKTGKSNDS